MAFPGGLDSYLNEYEQAQFNKLKALYPGQVITLALVLGFKLVAAVDRNTRAQLLAVESSIEGRHPDGSMPVETWRIINSEAQAIKRDSQAGRTD